MSDADDFLLEPHDVVAVRSLLLHYLPVELANIILDEARYWPNLVYTFAPASDFHVSANDSADYIGVKCCALSEPLPNEEYYDLSMKVAEVRFLTEAHDQGWCNPGDFAGPYDGSCTWFEAVIVRELHVSTSVSPQERTSLIVDALENRRHREPNEDDTSGETITQTLQLSLPRPWLFGFIQSAQPVPCTLITVKNPHNNSDVWDIQTNPRAQFDFSRHEILWARNDSIVTAEEEQQGYISTGRKSGKGFIDALRPGDRVAVLARAQYPQWTNFVKMVKLQIYFSV